MIIVEFAIEFLNIQFPFNSKQFCMWLGNVVDNIKLILNWSYEWKKMCKNFGTKMHIAGVMLLNLVLTQITRSS